MNGDDLHFRITKTEHKLDGVTFIAEVRESKSNWVKLGIQYRQEWLRSNCFKTECNPPEIEIVAKVDSMTYGFFQLTTEIREWDHAYSACKLFKKSVEDDWAIEQARIEADNDVTITSKTFHWKDI